MNSRIYPVEVFSMEVQKYLNGLPDTSNLYIPIRPITQADILQIKINRNLEAITQLIERINIKHCS